MQSKLRQIVTAVLIGLCVSASAYADVAQGSVVAGVERVVTAEANGDIAALNCSVGERITVGDALATFAEVNVYATQDGTVARVETQAGERASGTVLSINPQSLYTVYCTVNEAYESVAAKLVHCGETLYIKCTADGTHRGTGIISSITDTDYTLITTGGEFYIGETVYLYRDSEYSSSQRVGIGTLVSSEVEEFTAEGSITRMAVSAGESVERGQFLYSYIAADSADARTVVSPVDGIITAVSIASGDRVEKGQVLFSIADAESLRIEVLLEEQESASLTSGDRVTLYYLADREETPFGGTVVSSSGIGDGEDGYRLLILPDDIKDLRLGQTVNVSYGE